jgi:hypothetical protein
MNTRRIAAFSTLLLLWGAAIVTIDRGAEDSPAYDLNVVGSEHWEREAQYTNTTSRNRIGSDPFSLRQVPLKPHPNLEAVRVLAVGDSSTWGFGLRDLSIRWWELLELELDGRTRPGSFDVSTAAQPGASVYSYADWVTPETLQRVEPDVIVVLANANDAVPLGDETLICPQGGCGNYPTLDRTAEYTECMSVSSTLSPADRPAHSGECMRKTRARYGTELFSEQQIVGFMNESLNELFDVAMRRIMDASAGRPVIVVPSVTTDGDIAAFRPLLRKWEEAGAILSPNYLASKRMSEDPKNSGWWAHPLDRHPGYYATSAYAADAADAVLESLPSERLRKATSSATARPARLIDNFLPAHAVVTTSDTVAEVNASPWPGVKLPYDHQAVPCADIGRPHLRVMFDRRLPDTAEIRITLHDAPGSVTVYSSGYRKGVPVYRQIGTLGKGGSLRIVTAADDLRGILIAPSEQSGCDLDQIEIASPIRLTLERS